MEMTITHVRERATQRLQDRVAGADARCTTIMSSINLFSALPDANITVL
jgi:multisubunit Na+/H+ antiporter MnhF subunit